MICFWMKCWHCLFYTSLYYDHIAIEGLKWNVLEHWGSFLSHCKLYNIVKVLWNGTKLSIFPSKPWTWNKKILTYFECSEETAPLKCPSFADQWQNFADRNRSLIKTIIIIIFPLQRKTSPISDINVAYCKRKKNSCKNCYPIGSNKVLSNTRPSPKLIGNAHMHYRPCPVLPLISSPHLRLPCLLLMESLEFLESYSYEQWFKDLNTAI